MPYRDRYLHIGYYKLFNKCVPYIETAQLTNVSYESASQTLNHTNHN